MLLAVGLRRRLNGKRLSIRLKGHAHRPSLQLRDIDGHGVVGDIHDIVRAIVFQPLTISGASSKTFSLQNSSPIAFPFYFDWRDVRFAAASSENESNPSFAKDAPETHPEEDAQCPFSIEPSDGRLEPGQVILFRIHFRPTRAQIYRKRLQLVLEDVPRSTAEGATVPFVQGWPDLRVKANRRTELTVVDFVDLSVIGEGMACKVVASQSLLTLPRPIVRSQHATVKFQLTNKGDAITAFEWDEAVPVLRRINVAESIPSTSRSSLLSSARTNASPNLDLNSQRVSNARIRIEPEEGEIHPEESIEITVTLSTDDVGILEVCELRHQEMALFSVVYTFRRSYLAMLSLEHLCKSG